MVSAAFRFFKMSTPVYPHQLDVYATLRETAETFFSGQWRSLRLQPRFARLVVGPSGSGKTHVMRILADDIGVPLFSVGTTNWLPMGCSERGSRPTWLDIARFIRSNCRGIIFLDELDKLAYPTSWMTYIRVELFSCLDGKVPDNLRIVHEDDEEDEPPDFTLRVATTASALRKNFLVVGGGAFQSLWTAGKGSVGFGAIPDRPKCSLNHSQIAAVIPVELGNRFASPVLSISTLVATDYEAMLACALRQLPQEFHEEVKKCAKQTLDQAVEHGLGCRWIEQLLLAASIRLRQSTLAKVANGSDIVEKPDETQISPL